MEKRKQPTQPAALAVGIASSLDGAQLHIEQAMKSLAPGCYQYEQIDAALCDLLAAQVMVRALRDGEEQ